MTQQEPLQKINNEEISTLPALSFKGRILTIEHEEDIVAACEDIQRYAIIGFDTETRPSFKAGVTYRVALLQLSTPDCCYLFRLNKIPLARPLLHILESDQIKKIGVDVIGDIRSLKVLRHFRERGFIDLQSIIEQWGIGEKSLRKMSAIVLGQKISKAQRLSNWEAQSYTPQQKLYAATDAWGCLEIYNKLLVTDKK